MTPRFELLMQVTVDVGDVVSMGASRVLLTAHMLL